MLDFGVVVSGFVGWDAVEGVERVALHSFGTVAGHDAGFGSDAYLHSGDAPDSP